MKPRKMLDRETAHVMEQFLKTRRAELTEAVRSVTSRGPRPPDDAGAIPGGLPRATATFYAEIQTALVRRRRRQLAEVEAALERLVRGEYGFCGDCDGFIGLARLSVLPFAARCGRCQGRADLRVHRATRAVVASIGAGHPAHIRVR